MAMTDEEYNEVMGAYDDAINAIVGDICEWANAYEDDGQDEGDHYPPGVGFMAVGWTAAGDPSTEESLGRSLAAQLVKHGRSDIAERIDALLDAAPWRDQPPLVNHIVQPGDLRILDDDWVNGQWPETFRAKYDGRTYAFWAPPLDPDLRPDEQEYDLHAVAARAINFRVAQLLEG